MDIDHKVLFEDHPKPMLILSFDKNQILQVNNMFVDRYWSADEVVGRKLTEITRPLASELMFTTSHQGQQQEFLSLLLPDGNQLMIEFTFNKISGGTNQYYAGTIEELFPPLLEDRAFQHPIYRAVFDEALDIILVADDNGWFKQVNKTACEKLGYTKEELLTMNVLDITYSPMKSYGKKSWEDFLRTGIDEGEYLLESKSGTVLFTNYRAVANIRPGKHLSILRDISDKKRASKALKSSENRFNRLISAVPDAIFIVNEEGNIIYSNPAAEKMMGYDENELIGRSIEELVPESIRRDHVNYRKKYAKNPQKRSMGSGLDLKAVRKDGVEIPVDIMLGSIQEDEGLHVLAVVRDITAFKEQQNRLKQEKNFTKLLHGVATIANQAKSIDEALDKSIERICKYMNWPVGHAYLPADDGSGEFYPTDNWYLEDPKKYRDFRNFTMGTRFSSGVGMIGTVISTGKPYWIKNVHRNSGFVRRIPDIDLNTRACFGFPILVEDNVVGVLEFYCPEVLDTDKLLLKKMTTVGHQLGRVIERFKSREKLKRSEKKFKKLFDTAKDAILILGKKGLLDCNENACKQFRCSCEELHQSTVADFFPKKQPDGTFSNRIGVEKVKKAFQGKDQFFEWQFKRADGTVFDAEVSMIYMEINKKGYLQVLIRDISNQKKRDRLIQYNFKLFKNLFENAPVGLVMLDNQHSVQDINTSFSEMFGYNISEIRGKKIDAFLADDKLKKEAKNITEKTIEGETFQIETVRRNKAGKEINVIVVSVPVEIEDVIVAVFGIYVDITKQKEAEQFREQQLKEKEILLAEIHHRVKNNLGVISGLLELQKSYLEDEVICQKLEDSQARIQSMALIHEQLYQKEFYSALQFDQYVKSLAEIIASSYSNESVDIELIYNTEPVKLTLDQAINCGLLLNELLTNAYKYAFKGRKQGKITISVYENEGIVVFEVADNGIGIPESAIEGEKKSLGFTLIQTLTQQFSGELEISHKKGSCFTYKFEKQNIEEGTS